MSDLWTMQNQSTVQDLKRNTFFQSCEWCGVLADPTHKCPALSINRNQPAQPQLLECRAFEDKKRSSAKDTENAVDGPGLLDTKLDSFKAQNHWSALKYLANTLHDMLDQILGTLLSLYERSYETILSDCVWLCYCICQQDKQEIFFQSAQQRRKESSLGSHIQKPG